MARVLVDGLDSNQPDQMRFDHAAIAMVRSPWWETVPLTSWATEPWRGEVISHHRRHDGKVIRLRDCQDFVVGEILWR